MTFNTKKWIIAVIIVPIIGAIINGLFSLKNNKIAGEDVTIVNGSNSDAINPVVNGGTIIAGNGNIINFINRDVLGSNRLVRQHDFKLVNQN